jgi:tripartite-type tricarboxylate transporter receptor subunit TctC
VTDVATGAVTMSFASLAAALPLIKSGALRAVAVTSKQPMPQIPDVRPLSEGDPSLADYELLNWFAMFAPAKTPTDVMTKLNGGVRDALKDRGIADKLMIQGIVPQAMTLPEFEAFVKSESAKFGHIAKAANIEVQN